jgi:hypothetical protein
MRYWLLWETIWKHKWEWVMICALLVVMLLFSERVVIKDNDEESLLNQWLSSQQDASLEEQYEFYQEQVLVCSKIKEKERLTLTDYEEIDRLEYAIECYRQLWCKRKDSIAVQEFALGTTETIWESQVVPYLVDDPELFQTIPLCRTMNNKYLDQFLDMQKTNFLFVIAVIICGCIWGPYFANGIEKQEAVSQNGRHMERGRHILLLTISEGITVIYNVMQIFMSGLFQQTACWNSSVRISDYLQMSLTWMRIYTFLLVCIFLQMVNQLIWYMFTFLLLKYSKNIKRTYTTCVSACTMIYIIRKILGIYGKGSVILIGWYDLTEAINGASPVQGRFTTFDVGIALSVGIMLVLLLMVRESSSKK